MHLLPHAWRRSVSSGMALSPGCGDRAAGFATGVVGIDALALGEYRPEDMTTTAFRQPTRA
ncbi:hypothetical protein CKO37_21390 [Rubrivivax gelatinosus]|nr:hypothetical protein [Rubrivivax gelatinosus]